MRKDFKTAIERGDLEAVSTLLEKGVSVNEAFQPESESESEFTPLTLAATRGHLNIVKKLIESGAVVDAKSDRDLTALKMAAGEGNLEIVTLLLENGAEINEIGTTLSAIMFAGHKGHTNVVKLLLEKGAHIDLSDQDVYEAVIDMAHSGYTQIAKILMQKGTKEKGEK